MRLGFALVVLVLNGTSAFAEWNACDFYKKFIPSLAGSVCSGGKRAKPTGANSTFSSGFNLNPAATPTEASPYGLETIGSYLRTPRPEWKTDFALIKGFKRFGTGVSTSGSLTFYGNDVVRRREGKSTLFTFQDSEERRSRLPNVNLGTSFALNPSKRGKLGALKLGLTGRYNRITNKIGGGLGILGGNGLLTYGLGFTRERVTNILPAMYFVSAVLGAQLLMFDLEYNWLKNYGGDTLPPIHIGTATLNVWRFMFTGAVRRTTFAQSGMITQHHLGAQLRIGNHLSMGYLYNYIPGSNSVAFQFFL